MAVRELCPYKLSSELQHGQMLKQYWSSPVCKESTDEMFQHFIALHLQKTKDDINKTLESRDVENIFFIGQAVPSQDLNSPICVSV